MGSLFRRLIPVAGLALSLSACGFTAETASSESVDAVEGDTDGVEDDGGGGAAAGTCLEGTEDCVDADLSGDATGEPVLDGDVDPDAARRDAESLLGATEADLETWGDVRVERRGNEEFLLTMDLVPGRKTVQLDKDADGVYRVTTVTLELPDGETEVFTE